MQRFVKMSFFMSFILSKALGNNSTANVDVSTSPLTSLDVSSTTAGDGQQRPIKDQLCENTKKMDTTNPTEKSVLDARRQWFSYLIKDPLLLVTVVLSVLCLFLLIISLRLAYKVHYLKSSRHYRVQNNADLVVTEVCSSTKENMASGDGHPSETCLMMNYSSENEKEVASRAPDVETGGGEVTSQTHTELVTMEQTPSTETVAYHKSTELQISEDGDAEKA